MNRLPPEKPWVLRALTLTVALAAASVLVTTLLLQRASANIDALSAELVGNSAPSIEKLASISGLSLEVELALWRHLVEPGAHTTSAMVLDSTLEHLAQDVEGYLALPPFEGEREHWGSVREASRRFGEAVERTRSLADAGDRDAVRAAFRREVEPSGKSLVEAALRGLAFNARNGRDIARSIRETRRRTVVLATALVALVATIGVATGGLLQRESRQRRALVEAHARSLEERAHELEMFAARVAHDIRNPVAAVGLAAGLILRTSVDEGARRQAERIVRSVARADAITTDLLDFARAGAHPAPTARTDARDALSDLVGGFALEAKESGVELHVGPTEPLAVACTRGVYLSLAGNLLRNALKYMGAAPVRRIELRVVEDGDGVRTEVTDTGPGIAADTLASVFEPWVRGQEVADGGVGLGLATVRKLAEGHRGKAGATSTPGVGSTFWFWLPKALEPATTGPGSTGTV